MALEIRNHRLLRDGNAVSFKRSSNVGGIVSPRLIVLHDTAGDLSGDGSISWLSDKKSKVSAHFVVKRNGEIVQLVETNIKTWHAGVSSWRGKSNLNDWSIGIEIVNPGGPLKALGNGRYKGGVEFDTSNNLSLMVRRGMFPSTTGDGRSMRPNYGLWLDYSSRQIDAIVEMCQALVAAYPTITEIVTHWQIAPTRKIDTNPLFPLDEVRSKVFSRQSPSADRPSFGNIVFAQKRLHELGYTEVGSPDGIIGSRTESAILAFRNDHDLPLTSAIDDALLNALRSALPRQVSAGREGATIATLANLPQIKTARQSKWLAGVLAVPTAITGVLEGFFPKLTEAIEHIAQIKSVLGFVPGWAWLFAISVVAVVLWWSARRSQTATVKDYQQGRLT